MLPILQKTKLSETALARQIHVVIVSYTDWPAMRRRNMNPELGHGNRLFSYEVCVTFGTLLIVIFDVLGLFQSSYFLCSELIILMSLSVLDT